MRGTGPLQLLDERDELGRAAAPAGGLAISANDMSKWLVLQLAHGKLPSGERLFSEAAHAAMWKPEVLQPIGPLPEALKLAEPMFQAYALGWGVRDYRGTKIVTHGGAVLGFQSVVTLIPSKNIGIAIEINSEDGEIVLGLMYELLDHYLGFSRNDWPEKYSAFKQERLAGAAPGAGCDVGQACRRSGLHCRWRATPARMRIPGTATSKIGVRDNALTIDFKPTPRMAGTLEHWQYDTFVTRLDDKTIEPAYVTFALDADGKVERITMKPVSPLADFSYDYQDLLFTPVNKP